MLETELFKQELSSIRGMVEEAGQSLNIPHLEEQLEEYQQDMASPGFWDDLERAQKVNQRAHSVQSRLEHYRRLNQRAEDVEVLIDLAEEADDREQILEIRTELDAPKGELEQLKLTTLLTGEHDGCDCILALHAGAGGTEAQDWTQMLYRMYVRYGERMGFTVKELDMLEGDEAAFSRASGGYTGWCASPPSTPPPGGTPPSPPWTWPPSSRTTAPWRYAPRICASTPTAPAARAAST